MEDPLAEEILRGKLVEGPPINVSADEEKLTFSQKSPAEKAVAGD
jgi:ATP-dependent Clp protease ATP-binding subunit ClpA